MDAVLYSLEQPAEKPERPRCRAVTGYHVSEYGQRPIQCHQVVGLRGDGEWRWCVAPGHREQVRAMARRHTPVALRECPQCGSTETTEIHDERQSITVCAVCGSDEP